MSTELTALNLSILKLASKTRDFTEKTKKKTNTKKNKKIKQEKNYTIKNNIPLFL